MAINISLFVIDPERGPRDEADFANATDLAALLTPEHEAGLEITSGIKHLVIHDTLDDLILGICLGGAQALSRGAAFRNVSFAGFDSAEIATDGDLARFSIGDKGLTVPREEAIAALRAQAGRFGQLLQRVYPQDPTRAQEFIDFAAS